MAAIDSKASSLHVESAAKSSDRVDESFEGLSSEEERAVEKRYADLEQWCAKSICIFISSLFLLFIFNILDHSNIANARLGGLQEDLGLSDPQYQTAVAIMDLLKFVGYLLGQVPSNILLTRLKPSRYLPTAIFIWGGISICMAATKNFAGIMCVRVFLGFAESPFFSGALLLISSWYKPSEIAVRVAIVYCGNTLANGFGSMFAAGVMSGLNGRGGLEGWRWLFIIEGAGTMVAGLLAVALLPDFPRSGQRKWLSEQEQRFAEWRLARAANDEVDENGSVREGLRDALLDPKAWMLILIQVCQLSSQSRTYFFPASPALPSSNAFKSYTLQTIVKTLGFSNIITLLITAPVYVFGFISALGNSLIANRTNQRAVLIAWPLCIDIVGNTMVISSTATVVRYVGMFLMCAGSYSAFNVVQAWIASTIPRTRTKRAIVYALVNLFGNSANIYGSYFFPTSDSPQYRPGGITLSAFAAAGIVATALLALYLHLLNAKARRAEEEDGQIRYKYVW
ncbi:MFS general substrate transporter [Aspergillus sclerotioniger CBS 115572]|uniref:MFS general substrate transporter n=1 Tax=Aspergillus sclerotioniger CBS 115572 TaxID=1450535 RepID=A0A317WR18_9EURO|nr:MFS general substrate transporter [Aspergillus sclerotioniger CBS 115572]PWY88883.1 MFS general substrate transporter [Aspergillus sclerotioniger CBS 115572]